MGFNDSNAMFTMPVAPTGYGYGNGGFGAFGGDGAWCTEFYLQLYIYNHRCSS